MRLFFRRKAETWLILLAAKILMGRNVHRCTVVSRRDNHDKCSCKRQLVMAELHAREMHQ
ncbi:hypothetical protein [Pseudomonas chlororaphis]|uniref:hypothetical protein n=1 Tax=Pseudomonas chlororaphis TaxID=587753 RepID=UPI001B30FAB8|nr:hypothetical protein [Pseudomonas chlororaphis]MBP5057685.1 hypothetical protein [Pseudomonas chlororaphis]MBP5141440.1 hypothetical protein [Pseudomonas chlororaphis]QTT97753.1 hypothetical protein HUT26_28855 [Pseudomonas chlororaphis]